MNESNISQLLAGLFSAAGGIQQLTGGAAATTQAAGTANPFGSQYAGYQPQVQNQLATTQGGVAGAQGTNAGLLSQLLNSASGITGSPQALGTMSSIAGQSLQAPTVPTSITGSAGDLNTQLNALASNYMQDPSTQAEYELGLQSVERGLQASGYGGSGQQKVELEKFGQQFAAENYQQAFQDILAQSGAAFTQNTGALNESMQATQLGAGLQQQQFGQASTMEQLLQSLQSAQEGGLATAGQFALGGEGQTLGASQGVLNTLLPLSGATTGSPSTAGIIQSQQFGNTQQAISNLGAGLSGITGALTGGLGSSIGSTLSNLLNGLTNPNSPTPAGIPSFQGINDIYNSLLSSTGDLTGTFAGDTISGLTDSLGTATTGGLESLIAGGADTGASIGLSSLLGL